MKTFAAIFFLLSSVSAQAAGPICLNTDQIESSNSPDGKVLVVTMKNGTVWHTPLSPPCPNIAFNGFSWDVHGGQVCESGQILRVLRSGEICGIGKFQQAKAATPR